jgi:hypothetical protein
MLLLILDVVQTDVGLVNLSHSVSLANMSWLIIRSREMPLRSWFCFLFFV